MSTTTIGILLICAGAFAFLVGLVRPRQAMAPWRRWRILIGGPAALVIGILLLTGVIGG